MLDQKKIPFRYRDYRQDPLTAKEIRALLGKLGIKAKDVLRPRDKAFKELRLSGDEPDAELIEHIAEHPTLLQRPIGVLGSRAVVGRPVENLLELTSKT